MRNIIGKKPGLSITLEEIRLEYDREENRQNTIENKAGIVLGLIGILVPFTLLVFDYFNKDPLGVIYFLFSISGFISIVILWPKAHVRPHVEIGDFYSYANFRPDDLRDQLIINYIDSIEKNRKRTSLFAYSLYISYWFIIGPLAFMMLYLL